MPTKSQADPAKRAVVTAEMRLGAAPEKVFPLLCPVLEYDWIPGWDCDLVFTRSGVAEEDCVFVTHFPGEENEVWTVSRYEPPRRIEFVRFLPAKRVMRYVITLEDDGPGATLLAWTKIMTGLAEDSLAGLEATAPENHEVLVRKLERMLAHYLEKGAMLPHEALTD